MILFYHRRPFQHIFMEFTGFFSQALTGRQLQQQSTDSGTLLHFFCATISAFHKVKPPLWVDSSLHHNEGLHKIQNSH